MQKISLRSDDRILICGKTGSGKTFLGRYITRPLSRLVVLDGKGTLAEWELAPYDTEAKRALMRNEPIRTRVVAPIGVDNLDFWDEVLRVCFVAGNVTIYIDELYAVSPPNNRASNILWSAYTRGRELGVGVWSSTQRPVWIPLFALSEAEHFFMFRLQLNDDRARMSEFMGTEVLQSIHDLHGFYYSRAIDDSPQYNKQLEVQEDGRGKLIKVVNERPKFPIKKLSHSAIRTATLKRSLPNEP